MYKQIVLPIKILANYIDTDFIISGCNIEAYKALTTDVQWPFNRLILIGEKGSGKTHLANIWATKNNAVFIKKEEEFISNKISNMVIENTEEFNDGNLLHYINIAYEAGLRLLMTTSRYGGYKIPDLLSRVSASYKILIGIPDQELIEALIIKFFLEKQTKFSVEVPKYIASRIERSFHEVKRLVTQIDYSSLSQKKPITVPFVKDIMESCETNF